VWQHAGVEDVIPHFSTLHYSLSHFNTFPQFQSTRSVVVGLRMDSVALSLTSGRRKSMGAYRGRPGTGRSSRRNLPGCGGLDVVALAAAGMTGHRTVLEAEPARMWRRRRDGAGGGRDGRTSHGPRGGTCRDVAAST